ncbi:MAG: hypothetical protein KF708_24300 [Pirellulales bacterium]|nr:hypothetical protein [Pirellulales bacterium]
MSRATQRLLFIAGAIVFVPALLALDVSSALARGWQFESRADSVVLLASLVAVGLVLLALALPAGRRLLARRGPQLALLSVSLAFAWLLAEFVMATVLASRISQPQHLSWPNFEITFHPDSTVLPGISGPARFQANSLGVRGEEWPARDQAYRILCLGGSTTECAYLDQGEAWPQLLADRLNRDGAEPVWVGNAGVVGYTSEQHQKFVEQSPLMAEIDALVVLVGINDLLKFLETEQLQVDRAAAEALLDYQRPFWAKTSTRELARRWVNVYAVQLATHYEDPEGRHHIVRRQERQGAEQHRELPPLERAIDEYGQRLHRMAEVCREKHVRLLFVTQPVLWDPALSGEADELLWLGWGRAGTFYDQMALRGGIDEFNARLVQVARETGVPLVDLSSMDGQLKYFYDDCHFNELGSSFVAEQVADWFEEYDPPLEPRQITRQDQPASEG